MGNSFGKIDDVSSSPPEQLSSEIYLDFAGFDQKCFIGRVMNVRRRNFARGSEKPRHAKGITRLLGTYQNVGFLPNGPYDTAVVDSQGFGFNMLVHRPTEGRILSSRGNLATKIVRIVYTVLHFARKYNCHI